jgi:hypothetical protein
MGRPRCEARVLNMLGHLGCEGGDFAEAERHLATGYAACSEHSVGRRIYYTINLAAAHRGLGNLRPALEFLDETIDLSERSGIIHVGCETLLYASCIIADAGHFEKAAFFLGVGLHLTNAHKFGPDNITSVWIREIRVLLLERLGEEQFERAYHSGDDMDLRQALRAAREFVRGPELNLANLASA